MAVMSQQRAAPVLSYGQLNMQNDCRTWMSQAFYLTRSYIVSVASGFGNADAIAGRLYALPMKLIDKIQLIFGAPSMNMLLHLLQMQAMYMITLTDAMKAGDQANVDATTAQLYGNADSIAAYYAKINPFWETTQWRNLLYTYIAMTIEEILSLMTRNYEKDLDIADRLLYHALYMGDYMASGIIQYLSVTQKAARAEQARALREKAAAKSAARQAVSRRPEN
jgi:hypothetical protein